MQMSTVQHQHMVRALAPNGADESLHIGRLPGSGGCNSQFLQPDGRRTELEFQAVNAVPVPEQLYGWRGEREGFAQLLGRPTGGGSLDDVKVQHFSALVRQDHKNVEKLEVQGGHREKIDRDHLPQVIVQERFPVLGRGMRRSADHVFGDGSLGQREAQLEQLAVDAGCAPLRIGPTHVPNERNGVRRHGLSASFCTAALPFPEEAKTLPMPADDGIGLHELEPEPPSAPGTGKPCSEGPVQKAQPGPAGISGQHRELVTPG